MTTESSMNYVCITTNQPDTQCNPKPNPDPTAKQLAIVSNQVNIVACPTYQKKLYETMLLHRF